jgi:4'-phosphopantetheinyl transferase
LQVYLIPLVTAQDRLDRLAATLSPDEAARAARFRFDRDRRRFVTARGALRAILGAELGTPAGHVAFSYGPHGKPALAEPRTGLSFNLSHSGDWALCALGDGRPVGADIEAMRPLTDMEHLADRFYTPQEGALLRSLPAEQRPATFYRAWTCKEAYVKATGRGLAADTRLIDVRMLPGEAPGLNTVAGDAAEAARWSLAVLDLVPGYAAAVCVEGPLGKVTVRRFEEV